MKKLSKIFIIKSLDFKAKLCYNNRVKSKGHDQREKEV